MKNLATYPETELLRLLKQDSQEAFTEIYERYWERLFAIAYNRLKDPQIAEDITQDVFYSLWKNRKHADVLVLSNYLATAIKYATFGTVRKLGKIIYAENQTEVSNASTPASSIENSLDHKLMLQAYHTELNKLPARCKVIYTFSREEGLSTRQIAEKLAISPRTVETQISKALRILRKAFKNGIVLIFCYLF